MHVFLEGRVSEKDKWELIREIPVHFRNYQYFGHIAGVRGEGPYKPEQWHPIEDREASLGVRCTYIEHNLGWMEMKDFVEVSQAFIDEDEGICPEHIKNFVGNVGREYGRAIHCMRPDNLMCRVVIYFDS